MSANPEQQVVIGHGDGPLFNAAVAGCGKTFAAIGRIARLVQDGVAPSRIVALTFSKKAAGEMNKRLDALLGDTEARVGTWHSLALQVIKEDGLPESQFSVDEKDRHKSFVKEAVGYKHLDWRGADVTKLRSFIGYCKANLWAHDSDEAVTEAFTRFAHDARRACEAYQISDGLTRGSGLLTFDDMLVVVARHLARPDAAARWSGRWDYVIQDEAQDANVAQMAIARALASGHRNYMIVGDPAQSIYGFRGSDPRHFMAFLTEWSARPVYMNRNYRSGRAIIAAANRAIAPAAVKLPVEMVAERDADGSVRAVRASTLDDEAAEFVTWINAQLAAGKRYADVACLFRTNAQSRALEDALLKAKVPYVVVGGGCFYERKEVKDLLAYLRVASGRDRDGDALRRCVNAPFRFLGKAFVDRVMALAESHDAPHWPTVVLEAAQQARIQQRQVSSATAWAALMVEVERRIREPREGLGEEKPAALLLDVIARTGFVEWLTREEGEESIEQSSASNVRELARVAQAFVTTDELLDYIDANIKEGAKQRRKESGDRVLLMSIHRSKGLEWPLVWVVGCNDGILPHAKGDPEEERRLFYVAVTRARDELVCSYVETVEGPRGPRPLVLSGFLSDAGML